MRQKNNSLIVKIMFVMSGLLILGGAILLTLWRFTNNVLAENQQEEIGHLLNIYEASLEYGLHSTDNNLLSIAQEQKSLEELSNAEEAKRYYAATDLLDIIKRLRSNNDTVDMLIAIGNREKSVLRSSDMCYQLPATTVRALAEELKEKLHMDVIQIVGDPETPVERAGILVGGGSLGLGREAMPMELMEREKLDVLICGEILEWTICAYVRDAAMLGMHKALIIPGHNRTEEAGMKYLPEWLEPLAPGIPINFVEAGEPFSYL